MYFKIEFIPVIKAEFSAAITPVFSVTWSFSNSTDVLIWCPQFFFHHIVIINFENSYFT